MHAATASGREDEIARAYREVLATAAALGIGTIALPSLGSGTGGLDVARSAELLREAIDSAGELGRLTRIFCVLYDAPSSDAFARVLGRYEA